MTGDEIRIFEEQRNKATCSNTCSRLLFPETFSTLKISVKLITNHGRVHITALFRLCGREFQKDVYVDRPY